MTKDKSPTAEDRNLDIAMPPIIEEPPAVEEVVVEEVVVEEVAKTGLDVLSETPEAVEEVKEETQSEKYQQKHFKTLRDAKDKAERERDEALSILRQQYQPQQQVADEDQEEPDLAPDDIPEWRHVEKKMKNMERRLQQYEQSNSQDIIYAKVKAQYPDFDSIVSRDNVEMLKDNHPEIAQTLNSSPDLYAKAISAYKLIKQFGISQNPSIELDKAKAQRNAAKPKSAATVSAQQGQSPLSRANAFEQGLTGDLKDQLLKEMAAARKGY
jgi:hypothetical protein